MQKSSGTPRWWDWVSVVILFVLVETVAVRLIATNWTPYLYLIRGITFIGCLVGAAMGYSQFQKSTARWLTLLYMLVILPMQWATIIDQQTLLEEQLISVGGRLFVSLDNFFTQRPVEDPIFFVAMMSILFWIISSWAGFTLVRNQNYLGTVLPFTIGLLVIQSYDNSTPERLWSIAFFTLLALLLLGRLNYLQNIKSWLDRRVFLSPDNRVDLISSMTLAAGLIIFISWSVPASVSSLNSAVKRWQQITKPWREFTQKLDNAFDAIQSTGSNRQGDLFTSGLSLGTGFSLSDTIMFSVQPPEIPDEDNPPRFYWQGRIYDNYQNGKWQATQIDQEDFIPSSNTLVVSSTIGQPRFRFVFFTNTNDLSLLYAPSQPVWVSRASSILLTNTSDGSDISAWFAVPRLEAGESYQVDAAINNPGVNELENAVGNYPAEIIDKYLQLPDDFSPRIRELAVDIAKDAQTPYDQAKLVTQYLRQQIEYSDSVDIAPDDTDPLEWFLFEYKKGYCVYYATTEVLMLRSLGIPARMVVGFSQGEYLPDTNRYVVRKLNAHAWPQVYFPGIGWVEFEPTGNQPELDRPTFEEDNLNPPPAPLTELRSEQLLPEEPATIEKETITDASTPLTPSLYLIPLFIILATLTVYFGRRYSIPERVPVLLRASYERNGLHPPAWIINWEQWTIISPTERSFESVNFGLWLLKKPLPVYATPIERAARLVKILPKVENEISALLDEHQTSLYTSRKADITRARRAALRIRWQVILERIRYVLEGDPIDNP